MTGSSGGVKWVGTSALDTLCDPAWIGRAVVCSPSDRSLDALASGAAPVGQSLASPIPPLETYAAFHWLFLLPPLVGLSVLAATASRQSPGVRRSGIAVIAAIALVYTTPWDNYLIARGVWEYGAGVTVGTLWNAPIEEYLFVVSQSIVTGLWFDRLYAAVRSGRATEDTAGVDGETPATRARTDGAGRSRSLLPFGRGDEARNRAGRTVLSATDPLALSTRTRALGVLGGVAVALAGAAALSSDPTYYLGAILLWASPVVAVQWAFGWPVLIECWRLVAAGVAVPTAYFWAADRIAIDAGLWTLSERFTTGVEIAGLPIEEATFFLVTNLFVIQGLVLFERVLQRYGRAGSDR